MPALAEDVAAVEAEGIKLVFLASPVRFIVDKGRVAKDGGSPHGARGADESGGPRPIPQGLRSSSSPWTRSSPPSDRRLTSVFSKAWCEGERKGHDRSLTETTEPQAEGIFAGGDSAGVKAFVADAIASGKMGALAISCFLEGKDAKKELEGRRIGTGAAFSFRTSWRLIIGRSEEGRHLR